MATETRNRIPWWRRWGMIVVWGVLIGLCIAAISCGDETDQSSAVNTQISADLKAMIVAQVTGYPEALDAAITQQDEDISIVLVVAGWTSESKARELGDNAVRMTKSLSPDSSPGESIGQGRYNYLVSVYDPGERLIAQGAKAKGADRITW